MPRPASHSDVFLAVADPTRRAILDRLRRGAAPVNELASGFRISRPAVSKHLRVLRDARLVREKKDGRQRIYQLEPARIQDVAKWAEEYRVFWQRNITSLKRHLEQPREGKGHDSSRT
ncbi:MAG: metalloregulator ArsR/SmtB family transcription factor [Gemmatimonadales bacterium]